jgi:hypothetical protein
VAVTVGTSVGGTGVGGTLVAVGMAVDVTGVMVCPIDGRGNGVKVAVTWILHQARGNSCVGNGVADGVPVMRAISVPRIPQLSGVTGIDVGDGVGDGVRNQQ